jgi:hypothetical protein
MAYIGQSIKNGTFVVLDTSGNTYNGSNTTFSLGTQVGSPAQLLVSHDGVVQKPGTDYTLATGGTQITFTTAPASGASIFIVEISGAVGGPMNTDINGSEFILDVDGDTSITADTDDQIDVKIAGADDFKFTANTFTANSGSGIVVPDGGLTFGSTAISSTAAELNLLDGGTSVGSSITLADADGVVINDGGTMKTIPASDIKTYVGGGLSNADQFRLTSNFTGDANPISSNLSRVSEVGAAGGAVGSQMAVSSGVFTFPQTGMYLVEFAAHFTWNGQGSAAEYLTASIQVTTNNSSYTARAEGDNAIGMAADNFTWYLGSHASFLVDVTDTSNVKVRFGVDVSNNSITTRGNTNTNLTYMTFLRLGAT